MKIRIKFAKIGPVKYVGHLDMLRYFQKLIRRADIDICYSEGFNPHQKMSFAAPLGVGVSGQGEYVDIEVNTTLTSDKAVEVLNSVSVEGIQIMSYRLLPDGIDNAMSSVAAADYFLSFRDFYKADFDLEKNFLDYMSAETIQLEKETKKSTAIVDIKPLVFDYKFADDKDYLLLPEGKKGIYLKLAAGSVNNLKPHLVFKGFFDFIQREMPEFVLDATRLEVFGNAGSADEPIYKPLEDFGEEIL